MQEWVRWICKTTAALAQVGPQLVVGGGLAELCGGFNARAMEALSPFLRQIAG